MFRFSSIARPPWARLALLAALAFFYFGSLWVAALHFPRGYDWRRNVISNLLSPRDNPGWYWVPSLGVAAAGLCMLPLVAWIEGELRTANRGLAGRLRGPAFVAGIFCLISAAILVPQHTHPVLGMRHAHEMLARTSAAALGVGMICASLDAAGGVHGRRLRLLRRLWQVTTLPTLLGAIGSGCMVALARWGGSAAGAIAFFRGTIFWHLAFWEWAGSVSVYLFFVWPVVMLGAEQAASTSHTDGGGPPHPSDGSASSIADRGGRPSSPYQTGDPRSPERRDPAARKS